MKLHRPRNFLAKSNELVAIGEFVRANYPADTFIKYPDPPDAIIQLLCGKKGWIEVVSVYRSDTLARCLNTIGEEQSFVYDGTFIKYITEIAQKLYSELKKKDAKKKYSDLTDEFGKGILIMIIEDPWAKNFILRLFGNPDLYSHITLKNFDAVYLYERAHVVGMVDNMKAYPTIFHRII